MRKYFLSRVFWMNFEKWSPLGDRAIECEKINDMREIPRIYDSVRTSPEVKIDFPYSRRPFNHEKRVLTFPAGRLQRQTRVVDFFNVHEYVAWCFLFIITSGCFCMNRSEYFERFCFLISGKLLCILSKNTGVLSPIKRDKIFSRLNVLTRRGKSALIGFVKLSRGPSFQE